MTSTYRKPLNEAQKLLRFQQLSAGGKREAWSFVVQKDWNLEFAKEQLADKEEFRAWPSIQDSQMAPGASPRIFVDAYIPALKEAIEIIEIQQIEPTVNGGSLSETQKQLRYQQLSAGGCQEAWCFVVQCDWNLEDVRSQLADKEESRWDPTLQDNQMAPGVSTRIFIDAYIATLNEAIEIIEIQQVESVAA